FPHEGPGLVGLDLLGLDAPDQAVVEALGVLAEACREAQDGVEADTAKPSGGAAAAALSEVLGDGHEFVLATAQAEQGRVSPFRQVLAATGTAQAADALAAVGPAVRMQVAGATLAVRRAVGVGAGQVLEVLGAHRFTLFSTGCYHFIQPRRGQMAYGVTTPS